MKKLRIIAAILIPVLLGSILVFCIKMKAPSKPEEPSLSLAAERLLASLRQAESFSLDGTYSDAVGSAPSSMEVVRSDVGHAVGTGSVNGGVLSASLTLSGERSDNGTKSEYEEKYLLTGGELDRTVGSLSIGRVSLSEYLPLADIAGTVEELLTLYPLLSGEISSTLASSGVGYTEMDLYAFFGESASLYRLLLLRLGQGQLLTVPEISGDAAGVLAAHGRVEADGDGEKQFVFEIPTDTVIAALLDRLVLLSKTPLSELIDRCSGQGTAQRLLSVISSIGSGETLDSLLLRLESELFGATAESGSLLSALDAFLALVGEDAISETLAALSDTDAIDALRALTGDPSLSASAASALLSELLASTPSELLYLIGGGGELSSRLTDLAETARATHLTLSFPTEDTKNLPLRLSFAFAGETEYGYRSISLDLSLILDEKN